MDKFHTFLLFFLYSFSKHPQDETKTVVVVSSSKDDARMITTTCGVSCAGNFREERRERVYAGGEEKDTKGEGA